MKPPETTGTACGLLREEEMQRIRNLRKNNSQKASLLLKRKKLRLKKKTRGAKQENTAKPIVVKSEPEYSIGDAPTDVGGDSPDADSDNDTERSFMNFTELLQGLEGRVSSDSVKELSEIYERFMRLEETRASGKGGAGEELLEFPDESIPIVEERKKKKAQIEDEEEEEESDELPRLSKKKIKELRRPSIFHLKKTCTKPEVVESWDTTAPDPQLLVFLKAFRNTVVVPGHWSHKRRYLQSKRGVERLQFKLPSYIEATRISEIRSAIEAKDAKKSLKQRMREKSRPRHHRMNIDYQALYDAFFKYATEPTFTRFGDVYFEGKETEMHFRKYVPGKLSDRCREALGMTSNLDAPPWLLNMQRYGSPPSYPNLVVPGVNAHIPEGAALGFQPGGWGKPPTLEQLKIWGITPRFEEVVLGEDEVEGLEGGGELAYWGDLKEPESDNERMLNEPDDDVTEDDASMVNDADSVSAGIATPSTMLGAMTPNLLGATTVMLSGAQSSDFSLGLQTPGSVDLRVTGLSSDTTKPYVVIEQKKAASQASGSLFSSDKVYVVPPSGQQNPGKGESSTLS